MPFDPFANKIQFQPFIVESSSPCPRCACAQVLIAPTNNTHAASARCPAPGCNRFFRWIGKRELQSLAIQHRNAKKQQAVTESTAPQSAETTTPASLDTEQSQAARG
jgi:hypothetical protein